MADEPAPAPDNRGTDTGAEAGGAAAPEPDPLPQALRGDAGPSPAEDLGRFAATRRREALRADRPSADERRRPAPLGWLVFLLVVAAILAGLWFGRHELVARLPQAAALYDQVGIPVNAVAPDLELRDVTRRRTLADGENLLVVEGRIVNTANASREVPAMRVVLFDGEGGELAAWTFAPEARRLPPQGESYFSTSRPDPPSEARELSLTFAQPGT
jgi:hypothetical protein